MYDKRKIILHFFKNKLRINSSTNTFTDEKNNCNSLAQLFIKSLIDYLVVVQNDVHLPFTVIFNETLVQPFQYYVNLCTNCVFLVATDVKV